MGSQRRYREPRTLRGILRAALTRAVYVFHNPRRGLLEAVRAGREPDTTLLGLNHLGPLGIEARLHDALLTRRKWRGPVHRLAWSARELPLPWEVGDADVVFTPLADLFPAVARLRRRVQVVVVNYGLNLILERTGRARRTLLSASLRSADAIVCLGAAQRDGLIELAGVDPARVHVVLLGADVDWFRPKAPAPEDPYVLTVGKDLARDLSTFAAAVERLGVRAEIVAHPRNLEGVRLPASTTVRRGLSATELRDLYAGAACVVLPQQPDGYPYGSEAGGLTALCEALAMGKPIVATERAVLRDYLEPDELVPPGDPAALATAIEEAAGDEERGARSRRRAEERHSTRLFAQGIAPILRNSNS